MTYKYILFDLDGTISASGSGIIKAMQYGLTAAGINETDPAILKSFIGPPLNVQIQKIYGLSEKDTLAVIMKFREQYDNKGIFDSAPRRYQWTLIRLEAKKHDHRRRFQQAVAAGA